jgi:cytochrome b subunit of formate dehydrogenase
MKPRLLWTLWLAPLLAVGLLFALAQPADAPPPTEAVPAGEAAAPPEPAPTAEPAAGVEAEPAEDPAADDATETAESPRQITNADCLDCHTDATLTKTRKGQEVPMAAVDLDLFTRSVHGVLDCVDCHVGVTPEHDPGLPPAQCGDCHEQASTEYARSIHGTSHQRGAAKAATCGSCHGSHYMSPVKHPDSPVFKLNLPKTCADCHSNPGMTEEYHFRFPNVGAQYLDSIHGRALLKMGLIVAPSCNDCHGVHDIKRSYDEGSPISHAQITKTCGKCHVKVEAIYANSVHGRLLADGHQEGPVCTACHTAHEIEPPLNGHFKKVSDQRCGKCHEDRLTRYHETYHGKAMELGQSGSKVEVAACYDCHGHHDVLPPSDPASKLAPTNIVQTCQACHPQANAGFAGYLPHADPLDRQNYPQLYAVFMGMTGLLVGVFAFFGGHTALWLFRSVFLYLHDSKTFRETKIETQRGGEWFTRFTPFERFLHLLVVTSFLLLVITGMPLKFYYTDWAKTLFGFIGGAPTARWLHRFGAVVTFLYFGLHGLQLVRLAWRRRGTLRDPQTGRFQLRRLTGALFGPDSMIPTLQDWRDFVAHQRWFFGKGAKPAFDRWTYWEKFDYLAVFWGVFAIGVSGLVLWFPTVFTSFLPGWIINVALIIHSDEALLAAGFIFTIHFFNTHFRLEKFPMDTVIFSGRISKTEMLHERKRWHDRLVAEGRLDEYRVRDEWERSKGIARTLGYLFFGTGLVLLGLILYAMATRLVH